MRNSNVLLNFALTFTAALGLSTTAAGQTDAPIALQLNSADQIPVANAAYHTAGVVNGQRSAVVSSTLKPTAAGTNQGGNPLGFFPADLAHTPSGQTIMRAQHHLIYVNMPPSHWGNVAGFLNDFDQSDYIHILDQYVGAADNNRYTLGSGFTATLPPTFWTPGTPLGYNQVLAIIHAAASYAGSGYGHIYHLLLPLGMATCGPVGCYQPSGPRDFCGYHSSVTFQDSVGHAVFTVLPYAGVLGCEQPPSGTTHTQAEDSQNSLVAHETFEAITDPDANSWNVQTLDSSWGYEVADLCQKSQLWSDGNYYGSAQNIQLNGHLWTVPGMYSNRNHGCAFSSTQ